MFGHKRHPPLTQDTELSVDHALEVDIADVERTTADFLQIPSDGARRALLAALERLDDQTAGADAYQLNRSVYAGLGSLGDPDVIGETNRFPVAEEIDSLEFRAQVDLVKAAKAAVTTPSPEATEALRRASDSLTTIRTNEQATSKRTTEVG